MTESRTRKKRATRKDPKPPSNRGGARPGAGRPVLYTDLTDCHVYLDKASFEIVNRRCAETGENFSQAMRHMIAVYWRSTKSDLASESAKSARAVLKAKLAQPAANNPF